MGGGRPEWSERPASQETSRQQKGDTLCRDVTEVGRRSHGKTSSARIGGSRRGEDAGAVVVADGSLDILQMLRIGRRRSAAKEMCSVGTTSHKNSF